MAAGGFEPPKRDAIDLESIPFDQTRECYQLGYPLEHLPLQYILTIKFLSTFIER
jgi:hypothetical protein